MDKETLKKIGEDPEAYLRETLFNEVKEFFGDEVKAKLWFETKNPLLGEISPNEMMELGRYQKLSEFIDNQLAENKQ